MLDGGFKIAWIFCWRVRIGWYLALCRVRSTIEDIKPLKVHGYGIRNDLLFDILWSSTLGLFANSAGVLHLCLNCTGSCCVDGIIVCGVILALILLIFYVVFAISRTLAFFLTILLIVQEF